MDESEKDFMLGEMHSDIKTIKVKLDEHLKQCVTRREFTPYRNGMIAVIVAVLAAVGDKALKMLGIK